MTVVELPGLAGWQVVPQNIREMPWAACDASAGEMLVLVAVAAVATRVRAAAIWLGIATEADAAPIIAALQMATTAANRFTVRILQVVDATWGSTRNVSPRMDTLRIHYNGGDRFRRWSSK